MPHFVILSINAGRLEWSGEYEDAAAAFRDFNETVGIDPLGKGLPAVIQNYDAREVSAEQRFAVEAWWHAGGKAAEFPL